jgi:hypothetical protein
MAYSDLIEVVKSLLDAEDDIAELVLGDLFVILPPVVDFVC